MTSKTLTTLLVASILTGSAYLGVRELMIYRGAIASISAEVKTKAKTLPTLPAASAPNLRQTFLNELENCQNEAMGSTIKESSHYLGGINRAVKTGNHGVLTQIAEILLQKCMRQYILTAEDLPQMLARNAFFGERAIFPLDSDQWAKDWMHR